MVNVATGRAIESQVSLQDVSVKSIHTTPDGKYGWLILDYGIPAAVQPIREFKIMRATAGQNFQLIADTGKDKNIARLGLAQYYDPNPLPGGEALLFNDGYSIWLASRNGFKKIINRQQLESSTMKLLGNNGFRQFTVADDGRKWVAKLTMSANKKKVDSLVYGDISGSARIAAQTAKSLYDPIISGDGSKIAFWDYATYDTMIGTVGSYRPLKKVAKYKTYSPVFFNNSQKIYAVIGHKGTSTVAAGFIENLDSGKRELTHSGLLLPPNPGLMDISENGNVMISTVSKTELAKVEFANQVFNGPQLEDVNFRLTKDRLYARVKIANPDDVYTVRIAYLHQDYLVAGYALASKDNPYTSWGRLAGMSRNKNYPDYFDSYTRIQLDGATRLKMSNFLVSIQSKDRGTVANYIVNFN